MSHVIANFSICQLSMLSVLTRSPALRQQALRIRAFHASTPARSSGHDYHVRRLSQTIFTIFKHYME